MLYNKTYLLPATREVISSKEVLYFSAMEFLYLITGLAVGGVIAFVLLKNKSNEISALQQEKALALSKQGN